MQKKGFFGPGGMQGMPGMRDAAGSELDIARAVSIWQQHWAQKDATAQHNTASSMRSESDHEFQFKNLLTEAEARLAKDTGHGSTVQALRLAEQRLQIWGHDVGEPLPVEWLLSATLLLNLFASSRRMTEALNSAGAYLRKALLLEKKILKGAGERMAIVLQNTQGDDFAKKKHGAFLCWAEACFLLARTRVNLSSVVGELGRHRVAFSHALCAIRLITWGLLGPPVNDEEQKQASHPTGDPNREAKIFVGEGSDSDSESDTEGSTSGRLRTGSKISFDIAEEGDDLSGDDDILNESEEEDDEDPDSDEDKKRKSEEEGTIDPPWYSSARLRSSLLAGTLLRPAQEVARPELASAQSSDDSLTLGALHGPACEVLVASLLVTGSASENLSKMPLALQAYRSASQVVQGLPPQHPLKEVTAVAFDDLQSVKIHHASSPEDSDDEDLADTIKIHSDDSSVTSSDEGASADVNWHKLREFAMRKSFVTPQRTFNAMCTALQNLQPADRKKIQCVELLKKAKNGVMDRYELLGIIALRRLEFSLVQRFHTLPRAFKALDAHCKGSLNFDDWVAAFDRVQIPGASSDIAAYAYDYILRFSSVKGAGSAEMRKSATRISEEDLVNFCGHLSRCWKWLPSDSWSFCTEVDRLLRTLRKRLLEIYDNVRQAFSEMGWEGEHMITDLEFKSAIPFWNVKGFSEMDIEFLFDALDIDTKGSLSYMELEFLFRKQSLDDNARRGLRRHVLQTLTQFRTRAVARFGSLEKAVKSMDINRDHTVTSDEFSKAMERCDLKQDEIDELWKAIDFNNLGKIDTQELFKFLQQLGTGRAENNELVEQIKPQKVSEEKSARKAWIPTMQPTNKVIQGRTPGNAATLVTGRLKRMVPDRASSAPIGFIPEANLQKENEVPHLSHASKAALNRGEIDEPWLRATIEKMQKTVVSDMEIEAERYADEPDLLRELRQRHFGSVRRLVKAAQIKADLAAENRPVRPWSAAMDRREANNAARVRAPSSELKKAVREKDPSVKSMKNLVKYASTHFYGVKKKEESKRVLFQKQKPPTTGSPPQRSNSSINRFSSFRQRGKTTSFDKDEDKLEEIIETGLKKKFIRSATKVEEEAEFIDETTKGSKGYNAMTPKNRGRHITDKAQARRSLGSGIDAMRFVRKLRKSREARTSAERKALEAKEFEMASMEEPDESADPGFRGTILIADEVRHDLAGVRDAMQDAREVPAKVGDSTSKGGKLIKPSKDNTHPLNSWSLYPARSMGYRKKKVNAENLSELAQSVSRSSASAGKAKSMFGLSFLDPEPHYIEDFFAKGTDQGPHSQKKPEGSVKKSLAVSVQEGAGGMSFAKATSTPTHSDPPNTKTLSKMFGSGRLDSALNKSRTFSDDPASSTPSLSTTASAPIRPLVKVQRFDLWVGDDAGGNTAKNPAKTAPRSQKESFNRKTLGGPQRMQTQNLIGTVDENALEKAVREDQNEAI